ncbi:MAG: VWA domain-containing protein [Eubacterium sp.]|nr:VWA domain-containing protein [Eubacterium sp.]
MNENKKNSSIAIFGVVFAVIIVLVLGILLVFKMSSKGKTVESMMKHIDVTSAEPVKASISLDDNSLYDELPEITKYPLAVETSADIVIEVMTSPEKAGKDYESWFIDVAEKFNKEEKTTAGGQTIGVNVRSVSSGLAADYIISNKHTPEMFSPSNSLWGEYVNANGGDVTIVKDRLVGNTAGLLIDKKLSYKTFDDIISAVQGGSLNIGYTNPQSSSTGMNLLLSILYAGDSESMFSDAAVENFTKFQNNIPFVAYNTMQMRDSAQKGTLDGMIMEYQTYVNEENINKIYDFVPFGVRHDNPLYIVNEAYLTDDKVEAVNIFADYCMEDSCQKIATKYGFNANDDYKPEMSFSGSEVNKALEMYKANKDNGKDIIAVFVADCSGSMFGDPMDQLKQSLSNGMQYINENNYVGLVSYSDDVTIEVPIAKFDMNQKAYFQGGINGLNANGSTASYDAIVVAMDMIQKELVNHPDAKPMIFLLSDGKQNVGYNFGTIKSSLSESKIPVYTISYTSDGDKDAMQELADLNEGASINADSDDIIYKIKSLFNSQM